MHYHNWQLYCALLQLITFIWNIAKNGFVSTIPIHNFCMHSWMVLLFASLLQTKNCMQQWHLQLFKVLWQLLIHICTVAINYFCRPYFKSQLLYASLLFTAFVCAIVNSKLFMHYYISRHFLYLLLQLKMLMQQYSNWQLFIHCHDYWLLCALLQLTNLVCTIVIDNFFMHYCNWQLLYAI